jgi:hypothetical protein
MEGAWVVERASFNSPGTLMSTANNGLVCFTNCLLPQEDGELLEKDLWIDERRGVILDAQVSWLLFFWGCRSTTLYSVPSLKGKNDPTGSSISAGTSLGKRALHAVGPSV